MLSPIIHSLIKIVLASCDEDKIRDYDKNIIELAIKCICALCGNYDRKKYVPGEKMPAKLLVLFFSFLFSGLSCV